MIILIYFSDGFEVFMLYIHLLYLKSKFRVDNLHV